jgi:hypothetical protein
MSFIFVIYGVSVHKYLREKQLFLQGQKRLNGNQGKLRQVAKIKTGK